MKRFVSAAALVLLAALSSAVVADSTVYKWVDANGNVHYADQPPPQGAKAVPVKTSPETAVSADKAAPGQSDKKAAEQKKANERARTIDEKAARAHKRQCTQAHNDLDRLTAARRVRKITAGDKTEYYTGAEVEKLREDLKAKIRKFCD